MKGCKPKAKLVDPYCQAIFVTLKEVRLFCQESRIEYVIWGGCAIAAHVGHLYRKIGDIDIIAPQSHWSSLIDFLLSRGFTLSKDRYSELSGYKVLRKDDIKAQLFDTDFRVIDPANKDISAIYSFADALRSRETRVLCCLEDALSVEVHVLALEHLIVTNLLLPLRPKHTTDVFLLLACKPDEKRLLKILNSDVIEPRLMQTIRENLQFLKEIAPDILQHAAFGTKYLKSSALVCGDLEEGKWNAVL